ncbi:c-type cytochrome [Salibaculum sp.]|uniref:c-type cytochrome n=1 Tax=Salibaculum sp. TaxID=2855480 RepID=UPI002B49E351|nr:c-type cytochrome [Salibaculum sp.]HKL68654.1 c-type cytochrome [Salibaculum sp.]
MSKFPNQLALVAVAATSVIALSVGLSERAAHNAEIAAATAQAEADAMAVQTAEAETAEAEAVVTEQVTAEVAEAEMVEEVAEDTVAEAETAAPETVTAEATADTGDTFEGGSSTPALFVGAAWAESHESPMIGELDGISFDLGREALDEEVAAWDIDIRPDGAGLPAGSGDVWTGEEAYIENCAQCHGDFGEGRARWPVLAGGWDTLEHEDPVKTPGSYWPYLSTVWDYVHRAMPYGQAQSLTDDEVYAITAYILYLNNLVDDDFELSQDNFTEVSLPNEDGFFMDDRAEGEIPAFSEEPCMENCKDSVEITMRASVLDVTPEDEQAEATEAAAETTEETATQEAAAEDETTAVAAVDPALVEEGEGVFRKCRACHQVGEGARNGVGPHLNGVLGRTIGGIDGFRYSGVFQEAAEAGEVWGPENLGEYLADPRGAMPGTNMSFAGLRSEEEIAAITAYLSTFEAQ